MAFRIATISRSHTVALALAVRAVLIAALVYLALQLLWTTHLYATALVVAGLAVWVIADLTKAIGRMDRPAPPATEGHRASATAAQQDIDYRQSLLDTVAAALIVLQDDGRITLANRAARRLAAVDVYRLEQIAAIGPAAARLLSSLAPGARQIVAVADGRRMFVSVSQFSVPGQPPRRLLSLQRIAGELDAVEVKAWQDMAHVLAHEMMNSLTPISSLSESLELLVQARERDGIGAHSEWKGDEVAGALEAIRRRSRGLMDFVERYRQFAELPAPQRQRVSIGDLLSGIDRLMAGTFRAQRIVYRSNVIPPDLCCCADSQLLEQAMINLLRNAIDATAGVPDAQIEVACQLRDSQVIVTVTDNGRGLPADGRDQIFVPFFTTKEHGSGIGLSVARQVILAHGGQLDAWANEPRGTVFELKLPSGG